MYWRPYSHETNSTVALIAAINARDAVDFLSRIHKGYHSYHCAVAGSVAGIVLDAEQNGILMFTAVVG